MSYVDPKTVISPKNRVGFVKVLHDAGPGAWAAALLDYDGHEVIALRWNGGDGDESGIGNPQSRGRPTWFVVPDPLMDIVREKVEQMRDAEEGGLLAGYREMARDEGREREAQEWEEGLARDANDETR